MRLAPELLTRIKTEVPLETLCREHGIELSGHGKNLLAKCPFHEDAEASFAVTPNKNLWNCLAGCGGGDNIQLLMRLEHISFRRAADKLAERLGLAPEAATIKTHTGTTHDILTDPSDGLTDPQLMGIVADFYHATFLNHPQAMQYLQKRKCFHPEAVTRFKIGYANRTLGYRVPTTTVAGQALKERLAALGVMRKESGHEHLSGSVVFPITDRHGAAITQLYGRKITPKLRAGTPLHLYLEQPKRGLWNPAAVMSGGELILTESILDALTFWCAGFRNVTCTFGANGINEDLSALIHDRRPRWILMAQDNDKAGNEAVEKLAPRFGALGIGVKRLRLPPGVDANGYACQSADASRALAALLEEADPIVTHASSRGVGVPPTSSAPASADEPATARAADNEAAKEIKQLEPEPSEAPDPPSILAAEPQAAAPGNEAAMETAASPSVSSVQSVVDLHPETKGEDIFFKLGERHYRVRGLTKNTSFEALKINLRLLLDAERFHQDNLDMARAKEREHFARAAAAETQLREDHIKRDLARLLLKLEELQEEAIRRALEPKRPQIPGITEDEQKAALELLAAPNLLDRILHDFDACGVVGEDSNKLVGYLAATSRKFEKPLGVIVQSTSAAGKTTLMEAVLAFMPEEERIKYSAMTGQALFYLGEADIKHKILAIAEEEGAERATYALKLLQSEGELTIASTGKDAHTGRLVTETYHVEGPAMIFLTTTSIDLDEELANRCLTLTVDESREQTRRIHELQREEETIEGHLRKQRAALIRRTHQNAQRLLAPLPVHNPYARKLTFPDENTRLRRDQKKYLTLIRAIALLHQHQRPRRQVEGVEHVEVTPQDIATANRLAGDILGRSLDEMPPQTRRFLELLHHHVQEECRRQCIPPREHRFTQRDARRWSAASPPQVKRHLAKLADLEYLLVHRGGRGHQFVYELLYQGEGDHGRPFMLGLLDPATLDYDANRDTRNDHRDSEKADRDTPGTPVAHGWDTGGTPPRTPPKPLEIQPPAANHDLTPRKPRPRTQKIPALS